jgi:DNA-binding NarL/FixJ family response regulator
MLKRKYPGKKIIIYSMETSSVWVRAMHKIGVDAYITKDLKDKELRSAIHKVSNGEKVFPNGFLFNDETGIIKDGTIAFPLQSSQIQIINLLGHGWSVKQIAVLIGLNFFNTNNLLKKARRQLKVKNYYELIRVYQQNMNSSTG